MMVRCGIYARVSSEQQRDNTSIPQQIADCRAYAERVGWTVTGEYIDEAQSGRKTSRPSLDRLLMDVDRGVINAVLVWKLDRLARNTRLALELIDQRFSNILFDSVTDTIDRTSANGRFSVGMQLMVAQYQSDQLSERIVRACAWRAERGESVGGIPFGYDRRDGLLIPNDDAAVVRSIFNLYILGGTYTSIADTINAQGHSRIFGRESIRTILKNRSYAGLVSSGGKEYQGNHEPLIAMEVWHQAEALRAARTTNKQRPTRHHPGLLLGMAHCAACGSVLWGHCTRNPSRTDMYYYRCSGVSRRTCDSLLIRATTADEQITAYLASINLTDAMVFEALKRLQQSEAPAKKHDAASIKAALARYAEVYADGAISRDAYLSKKAFLEAQLADAPAAPPRYDVEQAAQLLQRMADLVAVATVEEKRMLVRAMFDDVWLNGTGTLAAVQPKAAIWRLLDACGVPECVPGVVDGTWLPWVHTPRWQFYQGTAANSARIAQ